MPTLTIDNAVTVVNSSLGLMISPSLQTPTLGLITVAGPQGAQGPQGTPGAVGSGVSDAVLAATGAVLMARDLAISGVLQAQIGGGGAGYVPVSRQVNGYPLTGNVTVLARDLPVDFLPGSTYSNLQQFINTMHSPGLIQGAVITDAGSGIARISAGTGMLRVADDNISSLAFVNIPATGIAVPADIHQYYAGFSYNSGNPRFELRYNNVWDNDTEISLGTVVNFLGTLVITNNPFLVGDPITNIIQRFDAMAPVTRDAIVGGLMLGEVGNRNVTLSAGRLWTRLNDYNITARDTSATDTIYSANFNGVYWDYGTAITQWPNAQYNNIAVGLVPVSDGYYANLWFYCGVENGSLGFIYGQAQWGDATSASQEQAPGFLPDNFTDGNILVARLTFQKGASSATAISSAFANVFTPSAVATHNNLGGLQGGFTNQYYHLDAGAYYSLTGIASKLTVDGYVGLTGSSGSYLNIGNGGRLGASAYTGVTGLNGLTGAATIDAAGGLSLRAIGQTLYVSGDNSISGALSQTGATIWSALINTSGNLAASGSTLAARDNAISGILDGRLAASGAQVWPAILATSGNLATTGSSLDSRLTSTGSKTWDALIVTSGNLATTGNTLVARDTAVSGALDTKLTTTGATIWNALLTTSGNLASSGSSLQGQVNTLTTNLTTTGSTIWNALLNTSGNVAASGAAAIARDLSTSGALSARLVASGAALSTVQVTGSSTIQTANFTGLGGTLVIYSGDKIFVSGASAAVAAGVASINGIQGPVVLTGTGTVTTFIINGQIVISGSQAGGAGVTDINGIQNSVTIATAGTASLITAGQTLTISGDQSISGALTATGAKIWSALLVTSGNLASTGSTAWNAILTTSGNLAASGASLDTRITSTGATNWNALINTSGSLNLTGSQLTASLSSTGAKAWDYVILVSGSVATTGSNLQSQVNTLTTNLTSTGATVWNALLTTSGNLATTGATAWGALLTTSGNLAATGSSLQGQVNTLTTNLTATGATNWNALLGTSGNLQSTGAALIARDANTSGQLDIRLVATGLTLGTAITSTGATIWNALLTTSGNLSSSGSNLQGQVNTVTTNLTATGATIWNALLTTSGNLAGTGSALAAADASISGALATKITNTGVILWQRDIDISGALASQISAGGGTPVKITGSSILSTADFTGIGGAIVFYSGNQVFISGSTPQAGAGVPSVNGITSAVTISGAGNFAASMSGTVIFISGSVNTLDGQVIFDGNGANSGNAQLMWDYFENKLTVASGVVIKGDSLSFTGTSYLNSATITATGIAKRAIAGIMESGNLRAQTLLGPSLWSRAISYILPATTTTQTLLGNTAANVGTLSTVSDQMQGQYMNFVSAAPPFTAAGTQMTTPYYYRGSMSGRNGFFFTTTFALSDGTGKALYGAPSGSRIFAGMSDQTTTATVLSNDPAGNRVGLSYIWATGGAQANRFDTEWMITAKDNTTQFTGTTTMNFQTGFYRFCLYQPPFQLNQTGVFWQLDDLIRGSGVNGVITGNLPIGSTAMKPGILILGASGQARNARVSNVYVENPGGATF